MSEDTPKVQVQATRIRSGAEIVADFVSSLPESPGLDKATIDVITALWKQAKFSPTHVLKSLEEARGKSKV